MTGEALRPFTISIPPERVAALRARLRGTQWPEASPASDGPFGLDPGWLRRFCDYWAGDYDWEAEQDRMNRSDHFLVRVQGSDVHVQIVRSDRPDAVPLLLTHGWPSTFDEMHLIAELLAHPADPAAPAFHVVVPSLPGFGFSPERAEPTGAVEVGLLWCALMTALGFDRFAAHGGDFGAAVTTVIAAVAPERLIGIHLTSATGCRPTGRELDDEEHAWVSDHASWRDRDWGYLQVQRNRPDSLAVALSDSPAGMAGWILDRWWSWTDRQAGQSLEDVVDLRSLATLVSLYWLTGTTPSSMRMYRRTFGAEAVPAPFAADHFRIDVPTAVAAFREPIVPPASLLEPHFDLRRYTRMTRGGHFPALESPGDLVADLRTFLGSLVAVPAQ